MTTEQFLPIWSNWKLRQYLIDTCKSCARDPGMQEDCLQEAALRILSEPTGQRSIAWYADQGRRAIVAARSRERRYRDGKKKVVRKYNSYLQRGMRRG